MIKIDAEFKALIPPLTAEEFEQLEKNILEEGIREPIITLLEPYLNTENGEEWLVDEVIIDGHNRYEIATKHKLQYKTVNKVFDNRDEVIDWMINNQLGRRNLSENAQRYLRGLQYKREKKKANGFDDRDLSGGQNVPREKTAEKLAEQHKVSEKTIKRDEKFSDAVDTIAENTSLEVKQKILNNEIKITNKDLEKIASMEPEKQKQIINKFETGESKKYKSSSAIIKEAEKADKIAERTQEIQHSETLQLFNDNCLHILKELKSKSIDMVLTDPPYAIDFKPSWSSNKWQEKESVDTYLELIENVCKELQRCCKDNAHLYFFTGWVQYPEFHKIISKYFDISNLIVWEKNNTSLVDFDKRYAFKHEFIIFAKQKGNNDRVLNYKQSPDVLQFDRVNNPDHSCQKPVKLLEYLINNSTIEGETVLDCFMGSASTGEASIKNNRSFIGIEIEKDIFQSAQSRMVKLIDK